MKKMSKTIEPMHNANNDVHTAETGRPLAKEGIEKIRKTERRIKLCIL